jgi:hypothetical protein
MRLNHPNNPRPYKPPRLSSDQKHTIAQWLAPRTTHRPCPSRHHHSHHPFPIQPTATDKATRTTTHTPRKCMDPMTNPKRQPTSNTKKAYNFAKRKMQNTRNQKHRDPNTRTNPIYKSARLETISNTTNKSRFRTTLTPFPKLTKTRQKRR